MVNLRRPALMGLNLGLISCLVFLSLMLSVLISPRTVRAASSQAFLKVGLLQEPKTLNPFLASSVWEKKVLALIYMPLYIHDPKTLRLIPWLAEGPPQYSEDLTEVTVDLKPARWSDGTPFTAEDVAFTANVIKDFNVPRHISDWEQVKEITVKSPKTIVFKLTGPMAFFESRALTSLIVPKRRWEQVVAQAKKTDNPLNVLTSYVNEMPVGIGPFKLKEWQRGGYVLMEKNKYFFAAGKTVDGIKIGPYVENILFKIYGTNDAAVLAVKKGDIDFLYSGVHPGFIKDLKGTPGIKTFTNVKDGIYYLGFNLRKKPFSDPAFRQAVAYVIDKAFLVERVLQGYGRRLDTIIPPANAALFDPNTEKYGLGMSHPDRIKKAVSILEAAGYKWKVSPLTKDGAIQPGEGLILPDGTPMESSVLLCPPADYDASRAMTAMIVQEWLRNFGIPVVSRPVAQAAMMQSVKTERNFDMFVFGWARLSFDGAYLDNFFNSASDRKNGSNYCGYRNPEFDQLAQKASSTINFEARREILFQMQRMIIRDLPYIPLFAPDESECVRDDRFTGWVNMPVGVGNTWTFMVLRPTK
ncbi:MAG: ABC transporter substrate-binding protein [Deltaproteobacteria bacterium]|nr:ABC transporter substrate-binding protein [Deltaproteobacteria bacterium]